MDAARRPRVDPWVLWLWIYATIIGTLILASAIVYEHVIVDDPSKDIMYFIWLLIKNPPLK